MDIYRILKEERDLARSQLEDEVRERFKHIINGDGFLIPRIAVKIAIDDIFTSGTIRTKQEDQMDTGEGRFEELPTLNAIEEMRRKYPKSKGIFQIGEELEIKGSLFQVKDISPFGIKLKLLRQPAD